MVHGGSGAGSAGVTDKRIGLVIGDYVITKKLAEGGMGAVYLAENRPTGVKLVVKFMLAEFVANPALRERFEREIRAAVRLKGKTNIVEIYSCNERDGEMYMTMEYLQGETLQDHVRRCGKISVHHAFRLIAQVIAALHELHEAGIIHRDLKPANIFVVPTDAEAYRVKLIDFGIIHDRQAITAGAQKTQHGALVGTPGYMALEQFGDAGNVTPAADVFALGVIVWEMFTGQLPWSAPNEFALYDKQKTERPVLPLGHHLPDAWQPILFQALSPNPADRPPLHALLYALARAVPAEPPIPSGFEMVVRYAPKVLRNTPVEVETVRAVDAQRAAAAYWGIQRATVAPPSGPSTSASAPSLSDGIPLSVPMPGGTPTPPPAVGAATSVPATVNARPVAGAPTPAAPAPMSTTISASSGVAMPHAVAPAGPVRARLTWIVATLAVGGTVSLLAIAVTMGLSRTAPSNAIEDPEPSHPVGRPAIPRADAARDVAQDALASPSQIPGDAVTPDASVSALPARSAVDAGVDAAMPPTRRSVGTRPASPDAGRATSHAKNKPDAARPHVFDPDAPAGED